MKNLFFTSFCTTSLFLGGLAQAEVWDCEMARKSTDLLGAVGSRIILEPDQKKGVIKVIDGLINDMFEKPLEVKLKKNSLNRLTFDWKVSNVPTSDVGTGASQSVTWYFQATFLPQKKKLSVNSRAEAQSYGLVHGTCKRIR